MKMLKLTFLAKYLEYSYFMAVKKAFGFLQRKHSLTRT